MPSLNGYIGIKTGYMNTDLPFYLAGESQIRIRWKGDIAGFYLETKPYYVVMPEDSLFIPLERAVFSFTPGDLRISIGREHINWGFGMFYNPVDMFNPAYSPFDYEMQRRGVASISIDYQGFPWIAGSIVLAHTPSIFDGFKRDSLKSGMRLFLFLNGWEGFISGVHQSTNNYVSTGIRKEWWNFVFYTEGTMQTDLSGKSAVFGLNRMIGAGGFLNIEYFYQEQGEEKLPLSDCNPAITGWKPGYTGKHYIYFNGSVGDGQRFTGSIYGLIHPIWRCGVIGATFSDTRNQNFSIHLNVAKIIKGGEFSFIPFDYTAGIDTRIYF